MVGGKVLPRDSERRTRRVVRDSPAIPVTGVAGLPKIKFSKEAMDSIVAEATKSVAKKMGVREDQLPSSVKSAIKIATARALDARAKALIQRDVDMAVKEAVLSGVSPIESLSARIAAAKVGITHISQDQAVEDVLKETAVLLWKKFNALKTAGFDENQAFALLLAEVQGRASRR